MVLKMLETALTIKLVILVVNLQWGGKKSVWGKKSPKRAAATLGLKEREKETSAKQQQRERENG